MIKLVTELQKSRSGLSQYKKCNSLEDQKQTAEVEQRMLDEGKNKDKNAMY